MKEQGPTLSVPELSRLGKARPTDPGLGFRALEVGRLVQQG